MIAMLMVVVAMTDEFDRLEGPVLSAAMTSVNSVPHTSLSFNQLGTLPPVLRDSRKAVLVVKTDEGNLARLIVSPGFRKASRGETEPLPVVVIERLDTMESGPLTKRIARARDLVVFDGFLVDLDSGQVVPEGQGGDLKFQVKGLSSPEMRVIAPVTMVSFAKSPILPDETNGKPSAGRTVKPTDFNGRYRIYANGQTSGNLELKASEDGSVTGRMTSDQTGSSYKLSGRVGEVSPSRVQFSVDLPRTRQDFEGLLFGEGKAVISGAYTMMNRSFGFVAIREGSSLAVDGVELAEPTKASEASGKITLELTGQGIHANGKRFEGDLLKMLREAIDRDPSTWVLVKASPDRPISEVCGLLDLVKTSGQIPVRLSLEPLAP